MTRNLWFASAISVVFLASAVAQAGVTPEEAAKLKTELTPFGAEKAGNKDGSIPAWDGGLTKALVPTTGPLPADQFPNEKPILVIDQKNVEQYADKISEGQKALIAKHSDYHLTVYPSHRTFAAPQWVYDNNIKNAINSQLTENGLSIKGAYGGTPFPIPKTGIELYWNHTLRYSPSAVREKGSGYVGSADGSITLAVVATLNIQYPYYFSEGGAEKWNGDYLLMRQINTAPAFKAGEQIVIRDNISTENTRQAWQYLVGQRRVRRSPTMGYDTPDFVASGANYFDETFGFWGAPDRYEWKLVGKKEMYIPYNDNAFHLLSPEDAFKPYHPNSDKLRWELHRVWVVDLTLASGKRHVVPKRRVYFDEDSYAVAMTDGYDAGGNLWRTTYTLPMVVADHGFVATNGTIVHNLQADTYVGVGQIVGGSYSVLEPHPDTYFTGDALASEALR